MRVMWSRCSQAATVLVSNTGISESCSLQPTVTAHTPSCSLMHRDSSSEASVSMDPTNSDEDPVSLHCFNCHLPCRLLLMCMFYFPLV